MPNRTRVALLALFAWVAGLAAASSGVSAAEAPPHATAIAWFAGDIDAAFAQARSDRKPLFLYWGATWCPPCNQVQATLFKRRDFIERSGQFIPVYLDGDRPNAQKLADRFRVRGYPTMILFASDGSEITRLPGEIDPQQYLQALSLGLGRGKSARATLRAALAPGASSLTAEDWSLLANYSWDTDEGQLVAADRVASTLATLARACPARYQTSSDRLALRAIIATAAGRGTIGVERKGSLAHVRAVLEDRERARSVFDLLAQYAPVIVGSLTDPDSAERTQLAARWDARLAALADDAGLSTADRLDALSARADLQKLADPNGPLPPALAESIRSAAWHADRETTDRYERQAVIAAAADALSAAGLGSESDSLLRKELDRSPSPYYVMAVLASNARKRGDSAAALDWYEKAYGLAQGPATRLQWGVRYVVSLTELAPDQPARVDRAVAQLVADLDPAPETFYGRNRASLERLDAALQSWNSARAHDAVVQGAIAKMDAVCAKLSESAPERGVCSKLIHPVPSAAAAQAGPPS